MDDGRQRGHANSKMMMELSVSSATYKLTVMEPQVKDGACVISMK